jgi:hypothetical protein
MAVHSVKHSLKERPFKKFTDSNNTDENIDSMLRASA